MGLDARLGANPLTYARSTLFIALGWNFLRLGISDRPEGLQGAWGWIVRGGVLGDGPCADAGTAVRRRVAVARYGPDAARASVRTGPFGLPHTPTSPAYVAAQVVGVAAGTIIGIAVFRAIFG